MTINLGQNKLKHFTRHTVLCLFLCITVAAGAQTNSVPKAEKATTIGTSLDIYLIDYWNGLDAGASVFYAKDFYRKGKHSFAYNPSFGFFSAVSVDTETRYILGLGVQYRFEATKRSSIRFNIAGNYTLTTFLYDRFEYNAQGKFVKQKNTKSNFGPSIGLQYSYDVFRIKSASFAPFIGYKLIKLEGGNYARISEGFKFSISLGILCKF